MSNRAIFKQSPKRRRFSPWVKRIGYAVLLILLAAVGYFAWIFFTFSFEGPPLVQEVALADLNRDGHLDAFVTISPKGEPYVAPDLVLFGEGNGRFTPSGQALENFNTFAVALGDLNNDGLVDAMVGNQLYRNLDNGRFRSGPYLLRHKDSEGTHRWQMRLADLNGDGDGCGHELVGA